MTHWRQYTLFHLKCS